MKTKIKKQLIEIRNCEIRKLFSIFFIFLISIFSFYGCGGGGKGSPVTTSTLSSISISPTSATLNAGSTQQFTATGTYSDNSTSGITSSVTWSSSDTNVGTINSSGLFTAVAAGTTNITASKDSVTSNSASITVPEKWTMKGYCVGKNAGNESSSTMGVSMADVILLNSGIYRMYYGASLDGGKTAIKYAESSDGVTWTVKGTALEGATSTSDPEAIISGPSVLKLSNGQYRMYYQSSPQPGVNEIPKFHVRSAISSDGVTFTKESGVRININYYDSSSSIRLAGHGTYFYASDNTTIVAIFSGEFTSDVGPSDLKYATSTDGGTTFENFKTLQSDWHDPIVIKVSGGYKIYATYLLEKQGTAFSSDGLTWPASMTDVSFVDSNGNILTEENSGIGDIGGLLLPSGNIRLYTNYGNPSKDIVYFEK